MTPSPPFSAVAKLHCEFSCCMSGLKQKSGDFIDDYWEFAGPQNSRQKGRRSAGNGMHAQNVSAAAAPFFYAGRLETAFSCSLGAAMPVFSGPSAIPRSSHSSRSMPKK